MATVVGLLILGWLGVTGWQAAWPELETRWPACRRWRRQALWLATAVQLLLLLWLLWGLLPQARVSADWSRLALERVQFWGTLLLPPWLAWWAWRREPLWRWRPLKAAPVPPLPVGRGGDKGKKKRRR